MRYVHHPHKHWNWDVPIFLCCPLYLIPLDAGISPWVWYVWYSEEVRLCRRWPWRWRHLVEMIGKMIWRWPSQTATCSRIRSTAMSGSRCCRLAALSAKNFRWQSVLIGTCWYRVAPSSTPCSVDRWLLVLPVGLSHLRRSVGVTTTSSSGRPRTTNRRVTCQPLVEKSASLTSRPALSGSCWGSHLYVVTIILTPYILYSWYFIRNFRP